jgi:hypothetical protein
MRVARAIAWFGVAEVGAVIAYGVGFYLGWLPAMPQQALVVFAVGAVMILGGSCYCAGWHNRGDHDRARQWRATLWQDTYESSVASLPAGAGPVDASLVADQWNPDEALLTRRAVPGRGAECAFGPWLGPRPGRAICSVGGCWHIASEPRGPGWSRTGAGGWLCPCEGRHELIRSRPTAAM